MGNRHGEFTRGRTDPRLSGDHGAVGYGGRRSTPAATARSRSNSAATSPSWSAATCTGSPAPTPTRSDLEQDDAGDPGHGADAGADDGAPATIASIEGAAWRRLATCYDPEIPIDIVNLGLVYLCQAIPLAHGGFRLDVRMTLTAPGCGMGTAIADEAREKLRSIPGVEEVDVDLVWDPPWSREMMSEAARLEMGLM